MLTLETRGILSNTAVVVVGDHSEAFKQHKGNYIHSLFSYEENLAVPALIYYPQRIKPGEINSPTSHVDLVPTLLDALQVEHSPRNFQGESLLRPLTRKYVFAYGNEGTVTAYGRGALKLQRLKSGECRLFDLAKDAREEAPANCDAANDAFQSADQYLRSQLTLLKTLQESSTKK
jgi:arylsulfatase A-like enzyme